MTEKELTIKNETLDELQEEVQRLLILLKDRQPGLSQWIYFMGIRLGRISAITERLRYQMHTNSH